MFTFGSPATTEAIGIAEDQLGICLPQDYVGFLVRSNGGEGWVDSTYLQLMKVEDLYPRFQRLSRIPWARQLVVFATDGASRAFAFDLSSQPHRIVATHFDDLKQRKWIADSFQEFAQALHLPGQDG